MRPERNCRKEGSPGVCLTAEQAVPVPVRVLECYDMMVPATTYQLGTSREGVGGLVRPSPGWRGVAVDAGGREGGGETESCLAPVCCLDLGSISPSQTLSRPAQARFVSS